MEFLFSNSVNVIHIAYEYFSQGTTYIGRSCEWLSGVVL